MTDNTKGNVVISEGVTAKGTLTAPGLIEVGGMVEGNAVAHFPFFAHCFCRGISPLACFGLHIKPRQFR